MSGRAVRPAGSDVFYCPPAGFGGDTIVIGGDEFNHLAHVMRKKEGDDIVIVDGLGNARGAVITALERRAAVCRAGAVESNRREPAVRVTLAAAILKNPSRYDFLVEKAAELGVDTIVPMMTERTIPSHGKTDRWRKLTLAAMKQSGRGWWPPVREPAPLASVLEEFAGWETKIVAHEDPSAGNRREGGRLDSGRALLLIGPEGGFAPGEIDDCVGRGCSVLYLGGRRLRAETAAVAALARLIA